MVHRMLTLDGLVHFSSDEPGAGDIEAHAVDASLALQRAWLDDCLLVLEAIAAVVVPEPVLKTTIRIRAERLRTCCNHSEVG